MFRAFSLSVIFIFLSTIEYAAAQILNNVDNKNDSVCRKPMCHNVAMLIAEGMNRIIDPCDDFYNYACGSWSTNHPFSPTADIFDKNEIITRRIEKKLKKILKEETTSDDTLELKIEKQWYQACMNEERLKKKGFQPLAEIINEAGGWPIIHENLKWNENNSTWQKVAFYYANFFSGFSLVQIFIHKDLPNIGDQILAVGPAPKYLYENMDYKKFELIDDKKLLIEAAKSYAKTREVITSFCNKEVQKVMDFQQSLMSFHSRNAINKIMTIKELQQFYDDIDSGSSTSKINWLQFIRTISGLKINEDEKVLVIDLPYLEKLAKLLNETSARTIVNYIHWIFVKDSLKYLDEENRKSYYDILVRLRRVEDQPRADYCLKSMPFYDGINQAYMQYYFPKFLKEAAESMFEELREEVEREIYASSWMDTETKSLCIEKLHAMNIHIGYQPHYENKSSLHNVYDNVRIGPDYFENIRHYFAEESASSWTEFKNSNPKVLLPVFPSAIDALYEKNHILITAAYFNFTLFKPMLPKSVNYALIVQIMAHEIFHGFSGKEMKLNKNGIALEWSEKMSDAYNLRAWCFVEQFNYYGAYGELTQAENIADSSGLIAAFEAYKKKVKETEEEEEEKELPGLDDINGEKLFFITYAHTFCKSKKPGISSFEMFDQHAPAPARVNGAVSNSKEFSRVFKCAKNSPMNPNRKCNILQ